VFYVQMILAVLLHKGFTAPPVPRPLLEQSVRMKLVGISISGELTGQCQKMPERRRRRPDRRC